ncbi:MAG: Hsp20/alpha crystallin family protein [Candidatus Omnitrophica bacterium]|nr:Hsp20/alpha crystallin family protein [Candidatus Omnitrophota bacterium]
MKDNKILVILVIVLAAALIGETIYLWNMDKDQKSANDLSWQRPMKMYKTPRLAAERMNTQPTNSRMPNRPTEPRNPFMEMEKVRHQMDGMLRDSFAQSQPKVNISLSSGNRFLNLQTDIKKTDNAYIVQMDIPGMKKEEINIDVQGSMLTISGQRNQEVSQEEKGAGIVNQEREFGFFSKSLSLPTDVNKDGIKAVCENGVLSITLPRVVFEKPAQEKPVKIKVE